MRPILFVLLLAACTNPKSVQTALDTTNAVLADAHKVHARLCAPEELANAQSNLDFARVEFRQGHVGRADEHLKISEAQARLALEKATPCGTADRDDDTIADVVDMCPDEPEDFDGDQDEDGCRDLDPYGDEDGDGIRNIDDLCVDDPEDFDGDADDDGCPEQSDDTDGDGLIDVVDACPELAEDRDGFQDEDGCPDPDNDDDTVVDIHDQCPLIPEDLDGWDDEDGCPDPDNDDDGLPDDTDECPNEAGERDNDGCPVNDLDGDGIADENDRCPEKPETFNNYLDQDGCPDTPPKRVKVTRTQVEILETIKFTSGKATLLSSSHGILREVATVLKDSPQMKIRVEGHTDNQGSDSFNIKLSRERAQSVRAYLISQGIDSSRLQAEGLGETRPIDTNRTPTGRAKNRRVEFHIVR